MELAISIMIRPLPFHLTQCKIIAYLQKYLGKNKIKTVWFKRKNVREDPKGYHARSTKIVVVNPTTYKTILGEKFLTMDHDWARLYPHCNSIRGESPSFDNILKSIGVGDASKAIAHAPTIVTQEAPSGWQNTLEKTLPHSRTLS